MPTKKTATKGKKNTKKLKTKPKQDKNSPIQKPNDLTALIVHQLRGSMVSLRWFLSMLAQDPGGRMEDSQKYLIETMRDQVSHMDSMIVSLLRISRVESCRVSFKPHRADLRKVLDSVLVSLKPQVADKNLNVQIQAYSGQVVIDEDFLRHVWTVLISNAIAYTRKGGQIYISQKRKGNLLECGVHDNGIGIPKAEQPQIFQKFFRASNSRKMVPDGNGLGLNLAKSLVEMWGGKMRFESQEGIGTAFYFTIPNSPPKERKGEVSLAV